MQLKTIAITGSIERGYSSGIQSGQGTIRKVYGARKPTTSRMRDFDKLDGAGDRARIVISRVGGVPANGQRGKSSEDDADEASYCQHDNRRNGEKPKHPKLLSILIGALIVSERREHRDLLLKTTGSPKEFRSGLPETISHECDAFHISLECEEMWPLASVQPSSSSCLLRSSCSVARAQDRRKTLDFALPSS
jgi:hypothetical protein